jgi:hypothetical protein
MRVMGILKQFENDPVPVAVRDTLAHPIKVGMDALFAVREIVLDATQCCAADSGPTI